MASWTVPDLEFSKVVRAESAGHGMEPCVSLVFAFGSEPHLPSFCPI